MTDFTKVQAIAKQTKQVLEQAEQDFADKVALIHENLRVARMTITNREVYEINKKYDDLQKEILDAIEYRYQQELVAANGDAEKIKTAEQNKAAALLKIDADMSKLKTARKEETDKAIKAGDISFQKELNDLKIKADEEFATGKEKLQKKIDQKYKKILEDNAGDVKRTAEIKAQKDAEFVQASTDFDVDQLKKRIQKYVDFAQKVMSILSGITSAWNNYQNGILQRDQDANDKQKAALKKQLDDKLISQEKYDAKVAKLDADMDKKKRKIAHDQAVVGKATSVSQSMINTAVAVTALLAMPPLAIAAGIMGALETALILATPIPQAATGRYNVIGGQDGKSYNGVPYQGSFFGIPGRPMLVNETGNEIVIDPATTRNLQLNYPTIIDGINMARVPQRASGQYLESAGGRSGSSGYAVASNDELIQVVRALHERLKYPLTANMSYDQWVNTVNTVDQIQKNASR